MQKILLVDDDESINFLNTAIINHVKFAEEVVSKTSVEKALEYIRDSNNQKLPDLILLDVNMPLMDGWDFIVEYGKLDIKGSPPKVIILTSSINPRNRKQAPEIESIDGFRSKPLSPEMLEDIYQTYFEE